MKLQHVCVPEIKGDTWDDEKPRPALLIFNASSLELSQVSQRYVMGICQ
jgi:hypothetical protein